MTTMNTTETLAKAPVTITDMAYQELKRIVSEQNIDLENMYLRVGVKGGGCSGLSYILGFDQKEDADEVYMLMDLPMVMNKAHGMYLMGMEIDWVNGLNNRGFQFINPNAKSTCGCGSSFAAS